MAKLLLESSSFQEKQNISGVGYYAKTLSHELSNYHPVELSTGPFRSNPKLNKIYRKLASYNLMPACGIFRNPYDLAIFPNFASLPTTKATKRAVVVHDLSYLKHPDSVETKNQSYLKRVVPDSISNCDFVITVSETVKKELIDEFKIDKNKVAVTPIPPRQEILNGARNNAVEQKYNIPTKKYLLFIGNLEPRKNVDMIIDAYLALPNHLQEEYSLIIGGGKGWNSEQTVERISSLQKTTNIHHIGYVDDEDMSSLYAKATIFLWASLYEGFGMPLLESLACDTPVIVSDIPVFREVLGDSGIYTNSSLEMTEQIERLCQNTADLDSVLNKQKTTLSKYSWKLNVATIEQLL